MKTAFYIRVSTEDQNLSNQLYELEALKQVEGWTEVEVFTDKVSGSKPREERPGFDAMLTRAEAGEFQLIAAWSIDRLSRDLVSLIGLMEHLRTLGVELYTHKERVDTSTSHGKAIFGFMAVIAQWERERISERTKLGQARARKQGKRIGRRFSVSAEIQNKILHLRRDGLAINTISKQLGCGNSTVERVLKGGT